MAKKSKEMFVDVGRAESERFEPGREVRAEFVDAARVSGEKQLTDRLRIHQSPANVLEDALDATSDDADLGERVGAAQPTQSEVDEIGKAVGLTYEEGEPMLLPIFLKSPHTIS